MNTFIGKATPSGCVYHFLLLSMGLIPATGDSGIKTLLLIMAAVLVVMIIVAVVLLRGRGNDGPNGGPAGNPPSEPPASSEDDAHGAQ